MTSNGSKPMMGLPGRTAAVILVAVAMLSAACAAQPETVASLGIPLLAPPQPPGMATTPEGAKGPTDCTEKAPQGASTPFDPQRSSYRPPDPMPLPNAMPEGTMKRIQQHKHLVAGVSQNLARFGYIDPHDGKWEGFDLDIVREIASAIFGNRDPNNVQFRAVNFTNQWEALKNHNVDILANTITITCERRYKQKVLFTTVYFEAGQKVMVPKKSNYQNLNDLAERKVCAPNETTSMGTIVNNKKLVPVAVAEDTDCLALLQQGQVDAISTDDSLLLGMIDQDPTMHMVGPRITDERYGLAIRDTEKDFVRFVNGVLERVRKDGTWDQLYQKWLTGLDTEVPSPPKAEYLD